MIFLNKIIKYICRILLMMLSILLIFMVNRIIKNDAIFSSENLLKFLIVIASIFIIYKLPFYLVLKKILKEKYILSYKLIKEVWLIYFMLFSTFGIVFFVFNFVFMNDYFYFSFYCLIISLLCGNSFYKYKFTEEKIN